MTSLTTDGQVSQQAACKPCHIAHTSTYDLRSASWQCCLCLQRVCAMQVKRGEVYLWGQGWQPLPSPPAPEVKS